MEETKKKRTRRPARVRLSEKMDKLRKRVDVLAEDLTRFSVSTEELYAALDGMQGAINNIPDEIKRARRSSTAATKFSEGDTVFIKESAREEYDGLISMDDMDELRVVSISKSKVYCVTPEEQKVVVPRSDVRLKVRGASTGGNGLTPEPVQTEITF